MHTAKWKTALQISLMILLAACLITAALIGTGYIKQTYAEEVFVPDKIVYSEEELRAELDSWDHANQHYKIQLGQDIQLSKVLTVYSDGDIEIDLNGFTISRTSAYLFNNYGKLSVLDSSALQTGTLKSIKDGYGFMFYNCGDLTLNVKAIYGDQKGGQQGNIVYSEIDLESGPENIVKPKLTINGGTYTAGRSMFYTYDGDIAINDGKFIMVGDGTTAGQVIGIGTMYKGLFDTVDPEPYNDYHKVAVKIYGGDFTQLESHQNLIKYELNSGLNPDPVKLTDFTVDVYGGKFVCEVGAFLAQGKWAPKGEDGFYEVEDEQPEQASAVVNIQAGSDLPERTIYFDTFARAFNVSKNVVNPNDRTVKLLDDASMQGALTLARSSYGNFNANGYSLSQSVNLTVDLNGRKLTISNMDNHIVSSNSGKIEFVMESSVDGGELILDYPDGGTFTSSSRSPGISLGNSTNQYTMTFKNITIQRTGYVPEQYHTMDPTANSLKDTALLQLKNYNDTTESKHVMKFIDCNIVSSLKYGSDSAPAEGEDSGPSILPSDAGLLAAFEISSYNSDFDITSQGSYKCDKLQTLVFEFSEGKECTYSWDISYFLPKGYVCYADGTGNYKVTQADKAYLVGNTSYETLKQALQAADNDGTIYVLDDVTETEAVTIDKPVRLVMKAIDPPQLTFQAGLTIAADAYIYGGIINGAITVASGNPAFETLTINNPSGTAFTLTKGMPTFNGVVINALTAFNVTGGKLQLLDGEYKGAIQGDVNSLAILGGTYNNDPEQYLYPGFGTVFADSVYTISVTPSVAAQQWYATLDSESKTIAINNEKEWLYLAAYVNSGVTFQNITVTLEQNLDFADSYFLPVGSVKHRFEGGFDGKNHTIQNIKSGEVTPGLFGNAGNVTIGNFTLSNCEFTTERGFLFDSNVDNGKIRYLAGGVVAEAGAIKFQNITLIDVKVGLGSLRGGSMYFGGVVGHSYSPITISGSKASGITVDNYWKSGGLLGFTEGNLSVSDTTINNVTFVGNSMFPEGVVAGNVTGNQILLHNVKADGPEVLLIGEGDYYNPTKTKLIIDGPETNIHVQSFGGAVTPTIKPEKGGSGEGFNIESTQEIEPEWFDFSALDGGGVNETFDENKHNYTVTNYAFAIYRDNGSGTIVFFEGFETLAQAFAKVENGDEIHVYTAVAESLDASTASGKSFTIVLNGYAINGGVDGIVIKGSAGNLSITDPRGSVKVSGKVTLDGVTVGALENSGTLTLKNVTLNAIDNNGELIIEQGATVQSVVLGESSSLNVADGVVAQVSGSGNVTVTGGTITGAIQTTGKIDITGGTFTAAEVVADPSVIQEYIAVEYVAVSGENALVVKSKANIDASDKIVAGSSATEFNESAIADGYCYVLQDGKYVVKPISVFVQAQLQLLDAHKQELLGKYLYSQVGKQKLDAIYASAQQQMADSAALNMQQVRAIVNTAQVEMDAVLTLNAENEANAQALEQLKKQAASELKLYAASNGVSLSDKSVTDGLAAIEGAQDEAAVSAALKSAQSNVDAAKALSDANDKLNSQQQALKQAKQQAVNDLKLYAISQGVALSDQSVSDGLDAIDKATSESAVEQALAAAQAAIDAAKQAADKAAADKQQQQQAEQALSQAKQQAANDLKLYAASNGVSLSDKSVTDGLAAIESAKDVQSVNSALTAAQGKVDEVKQAADKAAADKQQQQQAEQALSQAKQQAANDLKLYATAAGVSLDDASVTDGLAAIESAKDVQSVNSALTAAQGKVDAAKAVPTEPSDSNGWQIALICVGVIEIIVGVAIVVAMLLKRKKNN